MTVPTIGSNLDLDHVVTAYCRAKGCGHRVELDLDALAGRLGRDYELPALRERLRCERCGKLGADLAVSPRVRPGSSAYGAKRDQG